MAEISDLIDRMIRRNPLLPRVQWLRNLLREPYHRLLRAGGRGLPLKVGGVLEVRLPVEFCAAEMESYEVETATAIGNWVTENPGGLYVDIGCSYGYFVCSVLFRDAQAQVLGIDADLPSLAITRHICQYAPDAVNRLHLFRTLIGEHASAEAERERLESETLRLLSDPQLKVDPQSTNYVNLDTQIDELELPRISLDRFLLDKLDCEGVACMIKCDVEGAEQIVLQGARRVLTRHKPAILVSVHPPYLPKFDSSVDAIRQLLEGYGYRIDIIGVDHEEHWLCL